MRRNYLRSILRLTIVTAVLISFQCKEKEHPYVPNAYVNLRLNLTSTEYVELNSVGGWVYLTGGYRGLIVYRLSSEEFVAFDRGCPYDPYADCARIEMEESGLTTIDRCCGSKFLIIDGSVLKGPANSPLKRYNTAFDGDFLYITN
jgi:nitrite reductase/ring-hydroxylating ferredoxin subunit